MFVSMCLNGECPWQLEVQRSQFVDWQRVRVQENPDEIPPGMLATGTRLASTLPMLCHWPRVSPFTLRCACMCTCALVCVVRVRR